LRNSVVPRTKVRVKARRSTILDIEDTNFDDVSDFAEVNNDQLEITAGGGVMHHIEEDNGD
jgi:hypothetical protein